MYILRHGETEYNRLGRVQGSGVDTDLNELGKLQANAFYKKYKQIGFDQVITSKLKRTWQTVDLFIQNQIPWDIDSDINEVGWGTQEGQYSTPESRKEYFEVIQAWSNGDYHASMPEGESAHKFGHRLERFVNKLRTVEERQILVCSHGRAMRALMCLLHDLPLSKMQEFSHNNTGLWIFQLDDGKFQNVLSNDLSHLEEAKLII